MKPDMTTVFNLSMLRGVADVPEYLWSNTQPFLSRAFWLALEHSGAIGAGSSWPSFYLLCVDQTGHAHAMLPVFAKQHHRGEYVFDQAWANAYARYGVNYYPRLVSSVPFSPVVGARVWLAEGAQLSDVWPTLWAGVQQLAQQLGASSWHGLFVQPAQAALMLQHCPLAERMGCQFLWQDQNYINFDGFLAALTAKRRKSIRVERAKIAAQGIGCRWLSGTQISMENWQFFYQCYCRTYQVRGQTPYLKFDFFEKIGQSMPHNLALALAENAAGEPIAAALFFQDQHTLYGRYWGALVDADCLHFELCYYQGIDYALAQGLRFFDPGTQGEHKLIRGFAPVKTHSLHWLADAAFMGAIAGFVQQERAEVEAYYQATLQALPFKQANC